MEQEQRIRLAESYVELRRGAKALEVLEAASPDDLRTWLWRGFALVLLNRWRPPLDSGS